jgi:hypothetical protein
MAKLIASRDNPLTARVIVNRVWQWHFGQAIVRTVSDFGTRSEPPTHPEMLDWLATSLMDNGWSLKKLNKLIVMSATYQEDSLANPAGMASGSRPTSGSGGPMSSASTLRKCATRCWPLAPSSISRWAASRSPSPQSPGRPNGQGRLCHRGR